MVLDNGVANGCWIAASTRPSSEEDNERGGYGLQWRTMGGSEAFAAIGLQGQYVYIDPDTETMVVKLSYFPPGDFVAGDETLVFMGAVSKWSP